LSESELKIALGRLVENSKNGQEIKESIGNIADKDRRWLILTQHLCMERLQSPEIDPEQRSSAKIAEYIASINQSLVKLAFKQLLDYCCDRFEDSFDALFQRVAAVVDFGRKLSSESIAEHNLLISEPFFKILQVQENTADKNIYRLAFRFAQFLAQIFSVDGQSFDVKDPIQDDVVSCLFDNGLSKKEADEESGFELPADELEDLCKRKKPKTLKAFISGFRAKEDPLEVIVAFECFGEFAINNQSAIRAQSSELISTLLRMENKFDITNFSWKVYNCVVHTLISDLTLVPEFCERLNSVHGSIQRMQIVNCIGALISYLLDNPHVSKPSEKPKKKTREIGKVVRKSVALTKPTEMITRPSINVIDKVLRPFMSTLLNVKLIEKSDPITINGILVLLHDIQQKNIPGFRRIIEGYFKFLANVRLIGDWSTRMRCVQCYAGLAQMASSDSENKPEWSELFHGVDEWISQLVQTSISQSNKEQHVQLDEFQRNLCSFFGNMQL